MKFIKIETLLIRTDDIVIAEVDAKKIILKLLSNSYLFEIFMPSEEAASQRFQELLRELNQ